MSVQLQVEVQVGGRTLQGLITGNISMTGVLLRTTEMLPKDLACRLRIPVGDGSGEIRAEAEVVRIYPGAMAFQFSRFLDPTSFEVLRHLVVRCTPDPDRLEDELPTHAGIKPRRRFGGDPETGG